MLLSGFKIIAIMCYFQCLMDIEEVASLIFQGTGEGVGMGKQRRDKRLELPGKKNILTLRRNESLWYILLVQRGHSCPSCLPSPSFLLFRDLLLLLFLLLFLFLLSHSSHALFLAKHNVDIFMPKVQLFTLSSLPSLASCLLMRTKLQYVSLTCLPFKPT